MFLSTGAYAYAYIPTWSIETLSHLVTRDLTHQTHQTHTQQEEAYTIIMTTWVPVIMQPLSWVVVKCVYWPWINGTLNAWLYVHVHVCVWVWVMYVCVCVCVWRGVFFCCMFVPCNGGCVYVCVCVCVAFDTENSILGHPLYLRTYVRIQHTYIAWHGMAWHGSILLCLSVL